MMQSNLSPAVNSLHFLGKQNPDLWTPLAEGSGQNSHCLSTGLTESEMRRLDSIVVRRRVAKGDTLYRMGDRFANLYTIRYGHFKTHQVSANGTDQIIDFPMSGDLLGMDAIDTEQHQCHAVALEDGEINAIPFVRLTALFSEMPLLLRHFNRVMSREITREQTSMLLLGSMRAEQRLASFLMDLSTRYSARGYSAHRFQLRMSRRDIGDYLGLTIESVSRLFSRFKQMEWIDADGHEINLIDLPALRQLTTHEGYLH